MNSELIARARECGGIRSGSFDAVKQWTFTEAGLAKFASSLSPVLLEGKEGVEATDSAVTQARNWAQEARTQRATVLEILRYFGLPERDWEALSLIKAKVEAHPPAAATASEPSEGWMPIETAPKDGRQLLLGSQPESWSSEGYYDDARDEWYPAGVHWTDSHAQPLAPTHWMPLPAPPISAADKGE